MTMIPEQPTDASPQATVQPKGWLLLLGGWLAIGYVVTITHLILGAFGVIDLMGLIAAVGWPGVVGFIWIDGKFRRR